MNGDNINKESLRQDLYFYSVGLNSSLTLTPEEAGYLALLVPKNKSIKILDGKE